MRWTLLCIAACSSSHHATGPDAPQQQIDATPSMDGDMSGSDVLGPLMPQEVLGSASAVMAAPTVVAITYDGDANRTDTEAFYPQYAASPAWALQVGAYGVGALTVGTPRHLSGSAATTDTAVRQVLTTNLSGTTPAWGAPNESTLYSVILPVGTAYTYQGQANFCGGYHDDMMIGTVDVAYSVQLPCSFPPPITATQALTFTLGHELVEGVTDPRYEHELGWGSVDSAHAVWAYVTDGELADLCLYTSTFLWTDPPNMTYAIQRIWSNAAARAGTDPCIGAPAATYYQSVPSQPDDVTISLFGGSTATKGLNIAKGATGMLTLQVAGTPGSGPLQVMAVDVASELGISTTPLLTFTQPTGTFQIGDTVTIPVTVVAQDPNLGSAEAIEIDTKPTNGDATTFFYGVIGQ